MPTLFLGGDLMTGRGVDQILGHPGDPRLWEAATRDAGAYVRLAEEANGPIQPQATQRGRGHRVAGPVADSWPWGDALELLDRYGARPRLANLETSVTTHGEPEPGKAVHYRMAPRNVGCLTAARLDAVALANNHVLDFGRTGLVETLDTLTAAGIATAGAGRNADEAARPAIVAVDADGRVVLFSLGSPSSGIPPHWKATVETPGVRLLDEPSRASVDELLDHMRAVRRPSDVVVVSVHWGSNWGYDVPAEHIDVAHRLVDGGVDIVHGHSVHHPRPVEVYRNRLILYGVGDLIDDYEGIGGYEEFRPDLRLLPLATVDPGSGPGDGRGAGRRDAGRLARLRLVPMHSRQMRLSRSGPDEADLLCRTLNETSPTARFGVTGDGLVELIRPS